MCSITDRSDLFFVPESRDTGLFSCKNRAYLDGKQGHNAEIPQLGHAKTTARTLMVIFESLKKWVIKSKTLIV